MSEERIRPANRVPTAGTRRHAGQRIFELVQAALVSSLAANYGSKRPEEVDHIYLDCRRAEHELGWRPEVPLEDGIRRAVAFYKKRRMASPCL